MATYFLQQFTARQYYISYKFGSTDLGKLDRFVKEKLFVKGYLRYMDDFILFADRKEILHERQYMITEFVQNELTLELKENSIIAPCHCGFSFLGFRIFPNNLRLCGTKWRKFRREINNREKEFLNGKITEMELADSVRSIIGHISKADTLEARRKFFTNSPVLG